MAKSGFFGGGNFGQNLGEIFSRGAGGILPARGSQMQYDMVQSLLSSSMGAAAESGSPLLALLTPMLGGAIASRTQGLYDQGQQERSQEATSGLLELMGGNPRAAGLLEIMNNQDAPDHVHRLAAAMMGDVLKPQTSGRRRSSSGRSRRSGSRSPSSPSAGALRQYNEAAEMVSGAVKDRMNTDGLTREEALEAVQTDPMYSRQWAMINGGVSAPQSTRIDQPVVPETELAKPQSRNSIAPPPPEGTVEF